MGSPHLRFYDLIAGGFYKLVIFYNLAATISIFLYCDSVPMFFIKLLRPKLSLNFMVVGKKTFYVIKVHSVPFRPIIAFKTFILEILNLY